MTITIHLVRHAQGYHNLNIANQQIVDPYLTDTGTAQCAALAAAFPHHARITHLVASPMRRTLLTCYHSFQPVLARLRSAKVIALPLVQEISALPCDTGSAPAALAAEFGAWADLGLVQEGWNDKSGAGSPWAPWAPRVQALEERARAARVWLRELGRRDGAGEAEIVVVSHGGFLHFLTGDWGDLDVTRGTGWENTEYRSYEFDEPEGEDTVASLRETKPSWRQRRGSAIALTADEQREKRAVVIEAYKEYFGDDVEPK